MLVTNTLTLLCDPENSLTNVQIDAPCPEVSEHSRQPQQLLLFFPFILPEPSLRVRDDPIWWHDAGWDCDRVPCTRLSRGGPKEPWGLLSNDKCQSLLGGQLCSWLTEAPMSSGSLGVPKRPFLVGEGTCGAHIRSFSQPLKSGRTNSY